MIMITYTLLCSDVIFLCWPKFWFVLQFIGAFVVNGAWLDVLW